MDGYIRQFQEAGGSLVTLAKGNRSAEVAESCGDHGGFYLGTVGGPAARIAEEAILDSEVIAYEEFGMEAARAIRVRDFPAFVVMDHEGHDFYREISKASLGHRIPLREGLSR